MTEMRELFDQWIKKQKCDETVEDSFLEDGMIDTDIYEKQEEKILFLAKEGNTGGQPVSPGKQYFWLREVAEKKSGHTLFSNRICLLANAKISGDYKHINKDHDILKRIAFMNLNKCGGKRTCDHENLERYTKNYAPEIQKEIQVIDPALIICCGHDVYRLLMKYVSLKDSMTVIWLNHPSYFALSDAEYLYQLQCAIAGLNWQKERRRLNLEKNRIPKYMMVDTSFAYKEDSWILDMLVNQKFKAFGDAAERFMGRFNENDHIVYYQKGKGAIACGKVKTGEIHYEGDSDERYVEVEILAPARISKNLGELKGIPAKELNEIHREITHTAHKFWYASTIKSPYLTKEEYEEILKRLEKISKK